MLEQTLPKEWHELAAVQQKTEDGLLSKPNVVGVALSHKVKGETPTDEPAVAVLVNQKLAPELLTEDDLVPKKLDGATTDVVEVGDIFAGGGTPKGLDTMLLEAPAREYPQWEEGEPEPVLPEPGDLDIRPEALRRRIRPAMGGYSVGHYRITAGTMATACYDLTPFPGIPRKFYLLSNNHVLAASNQARLGDPILQPGPADGGRYPRDLIARLSRFVPIRFLSGSSQPVNYVDAAIAEGDFADLNREIYWIGYIKDMYQAPNVGMVVQKTGRTTNYTTGKITAVNATVNVNYGGGRVARFARQILTTAMSAPGDSGSMVTDLEEQAVGLLFAGSSSVTVINNILYVQALLRIRVHEG